MAVVTTNLGVITAYGDAVAAGYTGTKAEWQALMASYATVAKQAKDSADAAAQSATDANTAKSDAETAKQDAINAKNDADTAKSDAITAKNDAQTAKTDAEKAKDDAQNIVDGINAKSEKIDQNATEIEAVKNTLTDIKNETYPNISFNWVHGGIDNATGETNNNESITRSRDETYYNVSDLYSITNGSSSFLFLIFYTESGGVYTFESSVKILAGSTYYFNQGEYVRFDIRGSLTEAWLVSGLQRIPIIEDVLGLQSDLSDVLNQPTNLADPDKFTHNACMSEDGTIYSSTSYFYTEKIAVEQGDVLYVIGSIRFTTAFDGNAVSQNSIAGSSPITIPANVDSVIITGYTSQIDEFAVYKKQWLPYIPYGLTVKKSALEIDNVGTYYGGNSCKSTSASLAADTTLELADYPRCIALRDNLSAKCYFSSFGTLYVGWGYDTGCVLKITGSDIEFYRDSVLNTTVQHGLTIGTYLSVVIAVDGEGTATCSINTLTGTYTTTFNMSYKKVGYPFIRASMAMTNVILGAVCNDFRSPIWWFGDSYSGFAQERVGGQLMTLGYTNMLFDATPGQRTYSTATSGGYYELLQCLKYGLPKVIIWALGMNDTLSVFKLYVERIKNICDYYGIDLYVTKTPSVPNIIHTDKATWLDEQGINTIDWASAVGADAEGNWYTDYLSSDNVHPSTLGAKALAMQTLVDAPVIMEY